MLIQIVQVAFTIVEYNMACQLTTTMLEELCDAMHCICLKKKGNAAVTNLFIQSLESTVDINRMNIADQLDSDAEGHNVFWSREKCILWLKNEQLWSIDEAVCLDTIIGLAYGLCNFIYGDYSEIASNMECLMLR